MLSLPLAKRPATLSPGNNRITDRPEVEDIVSNNRPSGIRPRRAGRSASGLPTEAERRERRRLWLFVLFVLALIVPGSFFIGTARLTPYRAFLLLAVLPLLWQVARGALGRLTSIDVLFVCYALWLALATLVNEGIERYQSVVVLTIEALCGYLFGRVLVRNVSDYKTLMQVFLASLLVLIPFAIVEMLTKQNIASELAAMIFEPYPQATTRRGSAFSAPRSRSSIRSSTGCSVRSASPTPSTSTDFTARSSCSGWGPAGSRRFRRCPRRRCWRWRSRA